MGYPPALRERMEGKSRFDSTRAPPELVLELRRLTRDACERYRAKGLA